MIVYESTSSGFLEHVGSNQIVEKIKEAYLKKTGKTKFADKEDNSWNNSLQFMGNVIRRSNIPEDCGVLIEFTLPSNAMRVDFIVTGQDENGDKNFIIVELKQWKEAFKTEVSDLVTTKYFGGGALPHPSYQATSYKLYLSDYNENVYRSDITAHSCAFLHNYTKGNPEPLLDPIYQKSLNDSELFFKEDQAKLELFIQKYVGRGKGMEILYKIESGNIRPSKKLVDHVVGLFKGNPEFVLLGDQKVAYETAKHIAVNAKRKTTVIINGGPGTGKSVISMNLLGGLMSPERTVFFVAPNASFRQVMLHKLVQGGEKQRAEHLLKGSSAFYDRGIDEFDVIVVDEAHRLKDSTAYMYYGKNQVEDIIKSSRVNIFFLDERQIIRPEDIGSVEEIKRLAAQFNSEVIEMSLTAQFRCSGADGYVNWLTDVLDLGNTGNYNGWDQESYDFKIYSDPNELRNAIVNKAEEGHNARILAGYAWKWSSAKEGNSDARINDVEIPELNFAMPWNSRKVGTTWAINPAGINQVGCVHTAQGLEFDYVGVIIGNDLKIHDDQRYYTDWKSYKDKSGKKGLKNKPEELCRLVRNVYRILMTRGMKGCYVYFMDAKVEEYFKSRMLTFPK